MGCRAPGLTMKVLVGPPYCELPWAGLEGKQWGKSPKAKETICLYSKWPCFSIEDSYKRRFPLFPTRSPSTQQPSTHSCRSIMYHVSYRSITHSMQKSSVRPLGCPCILTTELVEREPLQSPYLCHLRQMTQGVAFPPVSQPRTLLTTRGQFMEPHTCQLLRSPHSAPCTWRQPRRTAQLSQLNRWRCACPARYQGRSSGQS